MLKYILLKIWYQKLIREGEFNFYAWQSFIDFWQQFSLIFIRL
jgi:hypothetical protein